MVNAYNRKIINTQLGLTLRMRNAPVKANWIYVRYLSKIKQFIIIIKQRKIKRIKRSFRRECNKNRLKKPWIWWMENADRSRWDTKYLMNVMSFKIRIRFPHITREIAKNVFLFFLFIEFQSQENYMGNCAINHSDYYTIYITYLLDTRLWIF